ncbi:MAG: hypothetical protein PGN34_03090 [Methylobacterium frigidaeris]
MRLRLTLPLACAAVLCLALLALCRWVMPGQPILALGDALAAAAAANAGVLLLGRFE